MLRRPPEILITTPESLFLLLTNRRGADALATVETVIIDEVHSIVDNRRGVQLMTSLERLVDVAGEFQRIALSATVRPLETVADYVGGYDVDGRARKLEIIESTGNKVLDFTSAFQPRHGLPRQRQDRSGIRLSEAFAATSRPTTSTLFFTNSRSLAEKVTFKLNEDLAGPLAYAHHGSLAREIRTTVESRLKAGELKAIVATSSLEMGIDIGHLDEVVLVQSPGSVARDAAADRPGRTPGWRDQRRLAVSDPRAGLSRSRRAGGRDRRARHRTTEYDDHRAGCAGADHRFLCAHASWRVSPVRPDHAQRALSQPGPRAVRAGHRDARRPLRRLPSSRTETAAALRPDRSDGQSAEERRVCAVQLRRHHSRSRLLQTQRHAESGAELGELDEEFVWEAKTGQVFSLGTQNWQVQRITHNDVLVASG